MAETVPSALPAPGAPPRRHSAIGAFMRAQPLGFAGAVIIAIMLLAGIFAEFVAPYDPLAADVTMQLAPPSWQHPLGTSALGHDILSKIIYGARTALVIGFAASFIGCTAGAAVGIASAYFGGKIDLVIQRFVEILLSFPIIVLAVVVVAMLDRVRVWGIDLTLIAAIAIPILPKVARVIRASALSIREMPYIDAARAAGFSSRRIIFRHMAPNVAAPYLILLTAYMAQAILLEASLSFLGLGVTEPTPSWGLMLAGDAGSLYNQAPWLIVFPGLAISLAVFAFNLFGDALRDWLDPKFKA